MVLLSCMLLLFPVAAQHQCKRYGAFEGSEDSSLWRDGIAFQTSGSTKFIALIIKSLLIILTRTLKYRMKRPSELTRLPPTKQVGNPVVCVIA